MGLAAAMPPVQECPAVVQLDDLLEDEHNVFVVTELCAGGDMQRFSDVSSGQWSHVPAALCVFRLQSWEGLSRPYNAPLAVACVQVYGPLSEKCLALIAREVLHIIKACHSLCVIHGEQELPSRYSVSAF